MGEIVLAVKEVPTDVQIEVCQEIEESHDVFPVEFLTHFSHFLDI